MEFAWGISQKCHSHGYPTFKHTHLHPYWSNVLAAKRIPHHHWSHPQPEVVQISLLSHCKMVFYNIKKGVSLELCLPLHSMKSKLQPCQFLEDSVLFTFNSLTVLNLQRNTIIFLQHIILYSLYWELHCLLGLNCQLW